MNIKLLKLLLFSALFLLLVKGLIALTPGEDINIDQLYIEAVINKRPTGELIRLIEDTIQDVNMHDQRGYTPLIIAVLSGDLALVQYLLSRGALVLATDMFGRDSLNYAAGSDLVPDNANTLLIIQQLLLQNPQDTVAASLTLAARGGYKEKVKLFLEKINSYKKEDLTLLKKKLENLETVYKNILNILVNQQKIAAQQVPAVNPLALTTSASLGTTDPDTLETLITLDQLILGQLREDDQVINTMDNLRDVNVRDPLGVTLLMKAARIKSNRLIIYLLNRGADTRIPDVEGNNALFYAVGNLLNQGEGHTAQASLITAPALTQLNTGLTSSEIFTKNKALEIATRILDATPPDYTLDPQARALRAAIQAGFAEVVQLLLSRIYYSPLQLMSLQQVITKLITNYRDIRDMLSRKLVTGVI